MSHVCGRPRRVDQGCGARRKRRETKTTIDISTIQIETTMSPRSIAPVTLLVPVVPPRWTAEPAFPERYFPAATWLPIQQGITDRSRRRPLSRFKLIVAVLAASAAAPTTAADAAAPRLVHTPAVAYTGTAISVVARFDHALPNASSAGFVAAPSLQTGEHVGDSFGGNPPGRLGTASRHCYLAEAIQPRPRATLHAGAKWRFGVIGDDERVLRTHAITLRQISSGASASWAKTAAARLGCN
jgi:hypothetical protein